MSLQIGSASAQKLRPAVGSSLPEPGSRPAIDAPVGHQRTGGRWRTWAIIGSFILLIIVGFLTLGVGSTASISPAVALHAIWTNLTGTSDAYSAEDQRLFLQVWELRVPRALLSVFGGAALAISGVLFQGLLRNPLVSPYTLGIAPAASFGAALAIMFASSWGLALAQPLVVVIGALILAIVSALAVLALGQTRKGDPATLILLGVAITQFFAAATASLQYIATDEVLSLIVQWTWGTVNGAVWYQIIALALVLAVLLPVVFVKTSDLNAIAFAGDDAAKSLGVPVNATRNLLIGVAVVLTAVTISFTGIIGFVGLVAPHIARLVIGSNHRYLLPFSIVVGALLLLVSDVVGRLILSPAIVPVGIVDAIVGAPIFLYLILARRKAH